MSDETEPEGAEGNEEDDIEDFPEDGLPANALAEMHEAVAVIADTINKHSECECPVCCHICELVPQKLLKPLEGLAERVDQFVEEDNNDLAMMYMSSLMTASAQVRSICRMLTSLAATAHEAYSIVETKTTVAVAKMTTRALLGADAKVLVGELVPGMTPSQGWPSGGSDGGGHGPN